MLNNKIAVIHDKTVHNKGDYNNAYKKSGVTLDKYFSVNRGKDFYNQHKSNNAMLIEVGTYTNDFREVKNTGKYLSRIIAEQLNGKK